MARFRCRVCGLEGTFLYQAGHHECPRCGARDVQFALGIEELPDDDPLIEAMRRLAEDYDKTRTD
jgi:rubredoxin